MRRARMIAQLRTSGVETARGKVSGRGRPADRARLMPQPQRSAAAPLVAASGAGFADPAGAGLQQPLGLERTQDCGRVAAGEAMQQETAPARADTERGRAVVMRRAAAHAAVRTPTA